MSAGQEAVLLISPGTQGSDYSSVADKFSSEMSARGIAVTEVPVDEVQDFRQVALAGGSSTVVNGGTILMWRGRIYTFQCQEILIHERY